MTGTILALSESNSVKLHICSVFQVYATTYITLYQYYRKNLAILPKKKFDLAEFSYGLATAPIKQYGRTYEFDLFSGLFHIYMIYIIVMYLAITLHRDGSARYYYHHNIKRCNGSAEYICYLYIIS